MLNMQFDHRVVIDTNQVHWEPSPRSGVWRKPLAREEAERGHATSIVRYDPGASFPTHDHPLGEEILVLEGTFSDEHGDFGAGSYIRNPPGSSHAPFSAEGCVLLVKLHQFLARDTAQVRISTAQGTWFPGPGKIQVMPLHEFEGEHVELEKWPAGAHGQPHHGSGGEEIFVLSGEFKDEHGSYPAGSWLRSPHMSQRIPYVDKDTVIWVKVGHLPIGESG